MSIPDMTNLIITRPDHRKSIKTNDFAMRMWKTDPRISRKEI